MLSENVRVGIAGVKADTVKQTTVRLRVAISQGVPCSYTTKQITRTMFNFKEQLQLTNAINK